MFTIANQPLEDAIKNSYTLQKKLNPVQIEKFVERALHLPHAGQADLLEKLQQEQAEIARNHQKARLAISAYERSVNLQTQACVRQMYKKAEEEERGKLGIRN
ncbi:MAG: hypothetical protein WCJ84_05615 [Candidatus Peregrinibacteria bacterium]